MNKSFISLSMMSLLILTLPGCLFSPRAYKTLVTGEQVEVTSPKKLVKDMNYEEARQAKEYYEILENEEFVLKCAERMVSFAQNQEETGDALMQLAYGYMQQHDYAKAKQHALDYQKYYPGTSLAKEASYIAIKAQFLSTHDPARDQSITRETIEQGEQFLKRYSNDKKYVEEIKIIMDECYTKLLDSEIAVINTYLARNNYTKKDAPLIAAKRRVAHIRSKLLPHIPAQELKIKPIELALAQALPDKAEPEAQALGFNHVFTNVPSRIDQRDATLEAAHKF